MGNLTKSFSYSEFADKTDGSLPENLKPNVALLAKNLQVLRDYFGISIHINSGYRTEKKQLDLKAKAITAGKSSSVATKSQHVLGKAADIVVKGYTPKQVHHAIEVLIMQGKMAAGGLGLYDTFVHYDVRGYNARWYENAGGKSASQEGSKVHVKGGGGHHFMQK